MPWRELQLNVPKMVRVVDGEVVADDVAAARLAARAGAGPSGRPAGAGRVAVAAPEAQSLDFHWLWVSVIDTRWEDRLFGLLPWLRVCGVPVRPLFIGEDLRNSINGR